MRTHLMGCAAPRALRDARYCRRWWAVLPRWAPPARVLHDLLAGDVDFALMDVRPTPTDIWFAGTGRWATWFAA